MAGSIIALASAAISALPANAIPDAVMFVERLFGHSKDTGKQSGTSKMATVVSIIQNALAGMANAGVIPSAEVVDASTPAAIAGAVQQVVAHLKANGQLDGNPPVAPRIVTLDDVVASILASIKAQQAQ